MNNSENKSVFKSTILAAIFAFITIIFIALLGRIESSNVSGSSLVVKSKVAGSVEVAVDANKDLSFTNKPDNINKELEMVADHAIARFKNSNGKTFADLKAISKKESFPKLSLTEYNEDNIVYKAEKNPENRVTLTVVAGKVIKKVSFN